MTCEIGRENSGIVTRAVRPQALAVERLGTSADLLVGKFIGTRLLQLNDQAERDFRYRLPLGFFVTLLVSSERVLVESASKV